MKNTANEPMREPAKKQPKKPMKKSKKVFLIILFVILGGFSLFLLACLVYLGYLFVTVFIPMVIQLFYAGLK